MEIKIKMGSNKQNKVLWLVILFFSSITISFAQEIKGIVFELESSKRLNGIKVKNLRTNQEVETDVEGNFKISGDINDYLKLSGSGYDTDTVFIYDSGIRRIYLVEDPNMIVINEVVISRMTDKLLANAIEKAKREGKAVETSQYRGGLRISPSRVFGRKGKQARSNLEILLIEQENRQVDRVFTNQLISSLTSLQEDELPLFREQFRPSLEFVRNSTPEDMKIYISESYTKYRKQKK